MDTKSWSIFLLVFLMLAFVSAVPPVTTVASFPEGFEIIEINYQQLKAGEGFDYSFHLYNSSSGKTVSNATVNCTFNMVDHKGTLILTKNVGYLNGYWSLMINGSNITKDGWYYYGMKCNDANTGGALSGVFEVTPSGEPQEIYTLISEITLLIVVMLIMLLIFYLNKQTDFDKWNEDIISNHKHWGQTFVNGLVYSIFKNAFVWYYFVGWLFVLVLRDIVYRFGSLEIYSYFTLIATVYSLGLILVVVYMIGHYLTYLRNSIEILTENSWGVRDGK